MNLIDMHCDTVWRLMTSGDTQTLKHNDCHVNIGGMKQANVSAQFFACFIYMDEFLGRTRYEQAYEYAGKMITRLKKEIWQYRDDIILATGFEEYQMNVRAGMPSAFITIEEGGIIHDDMARLYELYRRGVCLITLLWNGENCMGYPNSKDPAVMSRGLKPFGFQTVEEMNRLGMLVDVSHMSDGGFWDVIKHSKDPVVASHSNARALKDHPRNLTDEMLKALGEKGGVAGLNFYPPFLGHTMDSRIEEMTAHILHMINVGGEDIAAIGTDFDGFDGVDKLEIPGTGQMDRLAEALKKAGVTERQLEKIWSENAERVMQAVLR